MTITTQAHARFTCKPCSLDWVLNSQDNISLRLEQCDIELHKTLTTSLYDGFTKNLLEDRSWLAGRGGYKNNRRQVVAVSAPERPTLLIDPSGSSYARYAGVAQEL